MPTVPTYEQQVASAPLPGGGGAPSVGAVRAPSVSSSIGEAIQGFLDRQKKLNTKKQIRDYEQEKLNILYGGLEGQGGLFNLGDEEFLDQVPSVFQNLTSLADTYPLAKGYIQDDGLRLQETLVKERQKRQLAFEKTLFQDEATRIGMSAGSGSLEDSGFRIRSIVDAVPVELTDEGYEEALDSASFRGYSFTEQVKFATQQTKAEVAAFIREERFDDAMAFLNTDIVKQYVPEAERAKLLGSVSKITEQRILRLAAFEAFLLHGDDTVAAHKFIQSVIDDDGIMTAAELELTAEGYKIYEEHLEPMKDRIEMATKHLSFLQKQRKEEERNSTGVMVNEIMNGQYTDPIQYQVLPAYVEASDANQSKMDRAFEVWNSPPNTVDSPEVEAMFQERMANPQLADTDAFSTASLIAKGASQATIDAMLKQDGQRANANEKKGWDDLEKETTVALSAYSRNPAYKAINAAVLVEVSKNIQGNVSDPNVRQAAIQSVNIAEIAGSVSTQKISEQSAGSFIGSALTNAGFISQAEFDARQAKGTVRSEDVNEMKDRGNISAAFMTEVNRIYGDTPLSPSQYQAITDQFFYSKYVALDGSVVNFIDSWKQVLASDNKQEIEERVMASINRSPTPLDIVKFISQDTPQAQPGFFDNILNFFIPGAGATETQPNEQETGGFAEAMNQKLGDAIVEADRRLDEMGDATSETIREFMDNVIRGIEALVPEGYDLTSPSFDNFFTNLEDLLRKARDYHRERMAAEARDENASESE